MAYDTIWRFYHLQLSEIAMFPQDLILFQREAGFTGHGSEQQVL